MRDSCYIGSGKHKLNPQHSSLTLPNKDRPGSAWQSLVRQTSWSHSVPQGDTCQPCGPRGFCSDWSLLALYIKITFKSLLYPIEGKACCAGAPDPKQIPHTSHSCYLLCVCQRNGNEGGCAPAGDARQVLTVLAGEVSRAPNSGQECEWFHGWDTPNQMRGEVLSWWVLLCSTALGCRINQRRRNKTWYSLHLAAGSDLSEILSICSFCLLHLQQL